MIELSIIIPVYNTSKYLPKCIESCLHQDMDVSKYEIILVDDGSTDNSLEILRSYEASNANIHVYAQKNQKQGAARNNGLKKAEGKFIWFVDSDDWIEHNILAEIRDYLSINQPDLLRFDAVDHFEDHTAKKRTCNHVPDKVYGKHEALLENKFSVCVPFNIFKRTFLMKNGLKFIENIFYEDSEFMPRVFEKAEKFQYLQKHFYNVLKRTESTTRTADYQRKLDLLIVIKANLEYLKQNKLENEVEVVFYKQLAINVNYLLYGVSPSKEIFNEAATQLKSIEGIRTALKKSKYKRHQFQFWMLVHYPKILRDLLNLYYH